jgi:hypothetical protein
MADGRGEQVNEGIKNGLRMKMIWNVAPFLTLAALAFVSINVRAQKRESSGFTEDKGKFVITVDGRPAGTEDFSIARSGSGWVAQGTTEIHSGQGTSSVTSELHLNSSIQPLQYVWVADSGKKRRSTTIFEGTTARINLDLGDGTAPIPQNLSFAAPVAVVLDNNVYHHYEILARIYDWKAGGPQTLEVFIPQAQSLGTITAESGTPVTVDGAKYEQLTVRTPDLEVTLYLDSSHRLMRLAVPAAKAEVRRQ